MTNSLDIMAKSGASKKKAFWDKTKKWLLGGGLAAIISASIAFGISKEKLASELSRNKEEHVAINKLLDEHDARLDKVIILEEDIKWIRAELMRRAREGK